MRSFLSKSIRQIGRNAVLAALVALPPLACTDLTEVPNDALTPDNAFKSDAELIAGIASVYARLRNPMWGYYNLSEITTDEIVVPTRGSDWFDNGRWLEIYRQTWTANSGSALDDMNGAWNDAFSGVARANLMLEILDKSTSTTNDQAKAELRVLRAYFYYQLMDFFGGVPLVTGTALEANARETLERWHRMVAAGDLSQVASLCAPEAVFRSPVAHTPYRGAELVAAFLQQAVQTSSDFRYHRTFTDGESSVVLEFGAKVGDKEIKGIDMIRFDEAGRIVDFEVMVRPASGLQALGAEMARRMAPILAAKP